jgi:hypothetical protein
MKYIKLEKRILERGSFRGQIWDFKEQLDDILMRTRLGDAGLTMKDVYFSVELGRKLRSANGVLELTEEESAFVQSYMERWRSPIADQAVIDFYEAVTHPLSELPA